MMNVVKPNPYCIVQEEDGNADQEADGDQQNAGSQGGARKNYVFKYPKAKIFVGGLDFKLEQHDLMQHFSEYGEIESAVILKDTYTKASRGFGFVLFKDEKVAQHLINEVRHTNIFGRKVDIKSAEPKQQGSGNNTGGSQQYQSRRGGGGGPQYSQGRQDRDGYASIPAYGSRNSQ